MKKMLFKSVLIISFLLITFFSVKINSNAASFAYKDFDWEEFSKQNKNYWTSFCDEDDDKCEDRILKTKKRFYIKLYDLLTKVQNKYGTVIDDNIIIATVFYGLDGESFRDPNDEYSPYNIDDESADKDKYIGSMEAGAKEYFLNETDSLKTLVNSFIGYNSKCLAETNEIPQEYKNEDGTSAGYSCSNDEYIVIDGKCIAEVDNYKGTFFESLGISFFGNNNEQKCKEKINELGYTYYDLQTSTTQEVNEEFYWDFLENEDYLDKKEHLKDYYSIVLNKINKNSMNELTPDEKLEYKDKIISVRQRIIRGIKDVIKSYKGVSLQYNKVSKNMYWWPIGSDATNEVEGVVFANDVPSKTYISSNFGLREDPITKVRDTQHSGIDIPGNLGVTNVIASKDGVVSKVVTSCSDGLDQECGGRFGNYLMIQHVDGNYTMYAHLFNGSITLKEGDSVKQGQVLGKVGNSGKSTNPHLHFEIRIGGNDLTSAKDPINYISPSNPRPSGASSDILEWIGEMEGTGPMDGDNYVIYPDSGDVLTVGHGITLESNAEDFKSRGIDPSTLKEGDKVPKSIVDSIYEEDISSRMDNIKAMMSSNGITLNENQIAALISLQFNSGNIEGFIENYQRYGNSESLCSNWWELRSLKDRKGNYLEGLKNRRIKECNMFVNGIS